MKFLKMIKIDFFSTIDIYFYKELIPNYLFGLLFFTFINMLNELYYLIKFYIDYNVPIDQVFLLAANLVPFLLSYTIPIGILPAYLLSMGRLSLDSEITAMKSCGISTLRIFRPGICFGIIISILAILFTDNVVVPSNITYLKLRARIMAQKPAVELKEQAFVEMGGYKISFEKIKMENNLEVLYNIHVVDLNGRRTIEAEKGRLYTDPENSGHYILKFMNGSISEVMKSNAKEGKTEEKFFISSFRYLSIHSFVSLPSEYYTKGPDTMTLKELTEDVRIKSLTSVEKIDSYMKDKERLLRDINSVRNDLKINAVKLNKEELLRISRDFENKIKSYKTEINSLDKNISNYRHNFPNYDIMKYYEKYALPISSLIFALISLSIGMYTARSGRNEGLGISIVIWLLYMGIKLGTENLILKGVVLPVFEWFSDFFFLTIAIVLMIQKIRE